MPEHLPLPDEHPGPGENEQPNRADRVEDVRDADSVYPSWHSEDEDCTEHIPQESECSQGVADDFCTFKLAREPRIRVSEESINRSTRHIVETSDSPL